VIKNLYGTHIRFSAEAVSLVSEVSLNTKQRVKKFAIFLIKSKGERAEGFLLNIHQKFNFIKSKKFFRAINKII
jgi:hypothetical protein